MKQAMLYRMPKKRAKTDRAELTEFVRLLRFGMRNEKIEECIGVPHPVYSLATIARLTGYTQSRISQLLHQDK